MEFFDTRTKRDWRTDRTFVALRALQLLGLETARAFYLKHVNDLSQHNSPVQIILCKGKENEQETVGGLNILRNIHHEAWFQMIELFSHRFVRP